MSTRQPSEQEATPPSGAASRPIRILIADDHAIFRAGLRALLDAQPDMRVVGEAGDGSEAVARARDLRPDVVLLDISMPGMDGLAALKQMHDEGLSARPLVLTMHAEDEYLFQVLDLGGYGYVLKQAVDTDLFAAIRAVARGEVFLYPSAAALLLARYRDQRQSGKEESQGQALSAREREVLARTAEGYSSQQIGEQLGLSAKTVETYRMRVMRKLNLHQRPELVQYALRSGLLRPREE